MDDDILLWHVSFDIERPLIRTYVPLVPKNPMPGEDITIPRICFAPGPLRTASTQWLQTGWSVALKMDGSWHSHFG